MNLNRVNSPCVIMEEPVIEVRVFKGGQNRAPKVHLVMGVKALMLLRIDELGEDPSILMAKGADVYIAGINKTHPYAGVQLKQYFKNSEKYYCQSSAWVKIGLCNGVYAMDDTPLLKDNLTWYKLTKIAEL